MAPRAAWAATFLDRFDEACVHAERARYTLGLVARGDGGTATDRVRLEVRRPRR